MWCRPHQAGLKRWNTHCCTLGFAPTCQTSRRCSPSSTHALTGEGSVHPRTHPVSMPVIELFAFALRCCRVQHRGHWCGVL